MRPCPGCGSEAAPHPLLTKATWLYATCPDCGLVHLDPVPSPDESAALYVESYFTGGGVGEYIDYAADEDLHRINARSHVTRLARAREGAAGSAPGFRVRPRVRRRRAPRRRLGRRGRRESPRARRRAHTIGSVSPSTPISSRRLPPMARARST